MSLQFLAKEGVRLDDAESLAALDDLLEREKPDVVFLDSFLRFHSGNENDSQDMGRISHIIEDLRRRHGCAFVICHHRRKPSQSGSSNAANAFRGSTEIQAFPDSHLDLCQRHGVRELTMPKSRYQEPIEPCAIEIIDVDEGRTEVRYIGPLKDGLARAIQCQQWLRSHLSDEEWHYRQDIVVAANEAGYGKQTADDALKAMTPHELVMKPDGIKHRYRVRKAGEPIE